MKSTAEILKSAKEANNLMRCVPTEKINSVLLSMADVILKNKDKILLANKTDLELAEGKIGDVMKDRLALSEDRISAMAEGIMSIASLPTPLGEVLERNVRPNGLVIEKVCVPIGVLAVIYESRPNVTSDAAALALKSGNTVILRGGKEAYNTSRAITDAITEALIKEGLPENAVQLIDDTTRKSAEELMHADGYVDLLIPRGGAGLISACVKNATVPTLQTGTGICHIYVDKYADFDMALDIIENAKTSRPSVCNAAEVCLVHKDIAKEFLPLLENRLCGETAKHKVTLIGDSRASDIIDILPAGERDFDTEFLDYKLAVGVVDSLEDAAEHISQHSTKHSDAIITECSECAKKFTDSVDSAAVYVNASTRFTDGGEFGLGCEMGISTQKLHARGPVGIRELTTYKYIIKGNGQVR